MQLQTQVGPGWAVLTVWGLANAVSLLQTAGYLSRVATGSRAVNHALGVLIVLLAVPAAAALIGFARADAEWRQ